MKPRLVGEVTIPPRPLSIGGLLGWARDVNQCLAQLRDRKISGMSPPRRGGGSSLKGLFCGTYTSDGEWFLTGGTVTGGTGNITVLDEELVLGDVDPIPVNGTQTWLEISGTALTEDGLLMPGFNVSGVSVVTGATLPTPNQIPSAADPTGLLYLSLGMWSNGKFIPAGCGNIQVYHCLGFLSTDRTLP